MNLKDKKIIINLQNIKLKANNNLNYTINTFYYLDI